MLQVVALNTRGCVPHGHVPTKGVGEERVVLGADESVSVVFSCAKQKHLVMLLLLLQVANNSAESVGLQPTVNRLTRLWFLKTSACYHFVFCFLMRKEVISCFLEK